MAIQYESVLYLLVLIENKFSSIYHCFSQVECWVSEVGPMQHLPSNPKKLGLSKPLRIFPKGKNYWIWTTNPKSSNPRFFPTPVENSQSASFLSVSKARHWSATWGGTLLSSYWAEQANSSFQRKISQQAVFRLHVTLPHFHHIPSKINFPGT